MMIFKDYLFLTTYAVSSKKDTAYQRLDFIRKHVHLIPNTACPASFIHRIQQRRYRVSAPGLYKKTYDMMIACESKAEIESTKSLLKKEFEMKELEKYAMGKSVQMPLGGHFKLSLKDFLFRDCDVEMMSKVLYANAVGNLMYLMVCMRPNIAYAVSVVSRYLANLGKRNWEQVKWILRYLQGTVNVGLAYGIDGGNHVDVTGFVDSVYAKDSDKEAEYMDLMEAVKEANLLRGLLEELGMELNTATINYDNQGILEAKTVKVLKVDTKHNVEDALAKVVPGLKLQHCLKLLSGSMVDLGNNSFHGTIPNTYEDCGQLDGIILNGNQLEGEVPSSFSKCQSLNILDLGNNNLNGTFPLWLANLPELQVLVLKSNRKMWRRVNWNICALPLGEIPQSLAGIKGLGVLNLSQNHLIGRIPEGTQFNTFDESSFAGNLGLCGFQLPKKCNEQTRKPQLEAHENHEEKSGFTWEVVTLGYGCGTLLGLVMGYLMLSTRRVKWAIPSISLQHGQSIFAGYVNNLFNGVIPRCFGYFSSHLQMVDLGNNSFHGIILNENHLEGEVPSSFSKCVLLSFSKVSVAYTFVDLSSNVFGSEIPDIIGDIAYLKVLNLTRNNLTGPVPSELLLLSKLVSLDLSWNRFRPVLRPHVFKNLLQNFTLLSDISLGSLNLSLLLPEYLNISSALKSLDLRATRIYGKLPDNIFNLPSLEKLDLSINFDLIGSLPKRNLISMRRCKGGLYKMEMTRERRAMATTIETWHKRLGHASKGKLARVDFLRTRDKFDERGKPGVFLGYPHGTKGYKVFDLKTKRIVLSRDVNFHEEIFPFDKVQEMDENETREPMLHHEYHCFDKHDLMQSKWENIVNENVPEHDNQNGGPSVPHEVNEQQMGHLNDEEPEIN
nr:leucine-rich repeat-containing protein [Tanacetum cinerariifolium]